MRHILIGGLAALVLMPAAALGQAQPTNARQDGPALGDPAPPPPPAPAPESDKKKDPGVAEKLGGIVGGAVAKSAIVTTGPIGGIAVGLVGSRVGSSAVSVVKKMVGGDGKDDDLQAPTPIADPALPQPVPAAEVAAADAAATAPAPEPVKLAPDAQSIQTGSAAPGSSPSPVSNAASPNG